ncbi:hypothetical protein GCM10027059_30690 [Myceligenerans halotolerans]
MTTRKPPRRVIAAAVFALFAALAVTPLGSAAPALAATGTTYYVSATGSDTNTGTSSDQPWRSLSKVNSTTFQPGDEILLRSGDTWTGQLWPKGSGTDGEPITIDRYGSGAKPSIAGGGTVADAVRLFNQEYWEIRNLDVSNTAPATATPGENLGDFRGIGVHGDNGQTLHHFVIDSVDVHDVTGEINWIGGNTADNSPGITFGTGWDRSKNTGGIIFLTSVADIAAPGAPTVLDGITVQNSTIKNTSFAGITVKQYTGDAPDAVETGWGTRRTADDSRFAPHTDIVLRGNYITQQGTQFGSNGVYLTNVRGGLVEDNVVDRVGVSGIETYAADQVTVQFNEIFGTTRANGSADGNGMDPDIATTNQLFQYNYLHDNEDGVLLCACNGNFRFGSAVVRYNVVTGSTRWNLHMSQTSGATAQVYNNVFYSTEAPNMVSGGTSSPVTLSNNVFISERSDVTFVTPTNLIYQNNGYSSNLTPPSSESSPVVGDPQFVDSGVTGPYGDENGTRLDTAENFALREGSAFIDAGIEISGNGGRDFAGAQMPSGVGTDLGAFEAPGDPVYAVHETFDALPTGPLANGKNGWRVVATDNAVDIVETPSAGDKSVRLQRWTNGGGTDGTNLARAFSDPLNGVVTIEANVMRDDTEAGFFGLPYVYNAEGEPAVSVAFAYGEIRAYQGTSSIVLDTYELGRWYDIGLTIDTDAQRYSLDIDGQRVVSDAALRNALPGVARVAWYANGGERGSVHVDDVNIEAAGPVSGQTYRLRNESTGQYLDSGADGAVTLEPGSIYDDQHWTLTEQEPGYWTIDNVRSGRELLDTDPDGVVLWNTGWLGDDTLWAIDAVDGGFRIDNKLSGRGYLFGSGGSIGWNTGAADANTIWTFEAQ